MARPPQPRAGGPTVRSAPDPFTQFAANVEGYTRDRAHQGLDTIRRAASAPPDLSDAFSVFGITPRVAKEVGGAVGVLTSPGGGVGDAVGTSMWNNPGDPRGRRLGDLAQALTPIGPGKVVEGVTDAAKLTRGAANGLMRPYFARRTAQMAEEAASPSFAPLSRATSPNVGSSVTPHQQAAAAWEKVDDLHQRGETDPGVLMAASNDAVTQSRALGVPITGNARDMVGAHLEPADPAPATQLALSRRGFLGGAAAAGAGAVVAAHALPDVLKAAAPAAKASSSEIAAAHEAAATAWGKANATMDTEAAYQAYLSGNPHPETASAIQDARALAQKAIAMDPKTAQAVVDRRLADGYDQDTILNNLSDHVEAAADARKAGGPYADSPLNGIELEAGLDSYRQSPEYYHEAMDAHRADPDPIGEIPHQYLVTPHDVPVPDFPHTERGYIDYLAFVKEHNGTASVAESPHHLISGGDYTQPDFTFNHAPGSPPIGQLPALSYSGPTAPLLPPTPSP